MDPISSAIGGGISAIGGLIGSIFGSGDQDKAYAAMQKAIDTINKVGAPPDLAKQIIYNQFQQAGLYTPKLKEAVEQHFSNLGTLQDSGARDTQVEALNQLSNLSHTGFNSADRAEINNLRNSINQNAQSRAASITQNMQARGAGMGGASGAQLAAELSNSQNAANDYSNQGLNIAGQAASRALQALTQKANVAGQVRNTDLDVNKTRAAAADEMNRFNINNKNAINASNIQSQNAGSLYNLQNKQAVSNANTTLANNELLRQRNAEQQNYTNALNYAKTQADAYGDQANLYGKKAQVTRDTVGGVAAGVGQGASGIYQYLNNKSTPAPVQPEPLTLDEEEKKKLNADNSGFYTYA